MRTRTPPKHPKSRDGTNGRTPLHEASIERDVAACRRLLDAGADPNVADRGGWTALHFAAQFQATGIVAVLLAAGARVDLCDSNGNSALFTAVFNSRGAGEVIRQLRDAGADPKIPNKVGVTPAMLARTITNYNVAQYFVDLPAGE